MKRSQIAWLLVFLNCSMVLMAQPAAEPFPAGPAPTPPGNLPRNAVTPPPDAPWPFPATPAKPGPLYGGYPRQAGHYRKAPQIIRFSGADAGVSEAIEEDMKVMAILLQRTVDRAAGQRESPYRMGIPMLVTSQAAQAVYLEGFGALFQFQVNFPLVGPSVPAEKSSETRTETEWEAVRNELRGVPEERGVAYDLPGPAGTPYNSGQVAALKKEILETLKQGVNIRQLGASDFIAVTVRGAGNGRPSRFSSAGLPGRVPLKRVPPILGGVVEDSISEEYAQGEPGNVGPSVMTIRVKKSDVEAYSKGTLSAEAFAQKALVQSYLSSGSAAEPQPRGMAR